MDNKYIKVIYRSEPIGKDKIVLELTTFDYEAYEKDRKLEEKRKQLVCCVDKNDLFEFDIQNDAVYVFERKIEKYIDRFYQEEFNELTRIIKSQQEQLQFYYQTTATPKIKAEWFDGLE